MLEDGHYRRVGSIHEARGDVRIVAATNKDLQAEQKAGRFREDLFYRLNVVTIMLPPLRERREDIAELVEHFLTTRHIGPRRFQIEPQALEALRRYNWPGNVRELANVLERAQILADGETITLDELPDSLQDAADLPEGDPAHLREVERRHIVELLRQHKGNKVHAARALGVSRRALYRLISKYRLDVAEGTSAPMPPWAMPRSRSLIS